MYQLADVHCMCVCVWALLQEPGEGVNGRVCHSPSFFCSLPRFRLSPRPSVRLPAQPKLTPPPYALPTATPPRCQPGHASVMTMPDAAVAVAISHCRWRPFDVAFKCQNWLTANLRRHRNDPFPPPPPSTNSLNQHTTSPLPLSPSLPLPPKKKTIYEINKTKDTEPQSKKKDIKRKEQSGVGVPLCVCVCVRVKESSK